MANSLKGPIVVLDFKRKRVEMFKPGETEGEQTLAEALDVQKRVYPVASGIAPPPKRAEDSPGS